MPARETVMASVETFLRQPIYGLLRQLIPLIERVHLRGTPGDDAPIGFMDLSRISAGFPMELHVSRMLVGYEQNKRSL